MDTLKCNTSSGEYKLMGWLVVFINKRFAFTIIQLFLGGCRISFFVLLAFAQVVEIQHALLHLDEHLLLHFLVVRAFIVILVITIIFRSVPLLGKSLCFGLTYGR